MSVALINIGIHIPIEFLFSGAYMCLEMEHIILAVFVVLCNSIAMEFLEEPPQIYCFSTAASPFHITLHCIALHYITLALCECSIFSIPSSVLPIFLLLFNKVNLLIHKVVHYCCFSLMNNAEHICCCLYFF